MVQVMASFGTHRHLGGIYKRRVDIILFAGMSESGFDFSEGFTLDMGALHYR